MADINNINVDMTVLIGQAKMPVTQFLNLGRGGVIRLYGADKKPIKMETGDHLLRLQANGQDVAEAKVVLDGENIALKIV